MGAPRHWETGYVNGKRIATPEYRTWQNMKDRVLNPKNGQWKDYGGRGIGLDPRWHDFAEFLIDMGRRPSPTMTIERKDVNGNYTKGNCHWASRKEQNRNKRNNRLDDPAVAEIRRSYSAGEVTQKEIASRFGVTQTLISMIVRGVVWA
jgi:hypothetical protein